MRILILLVLLSGLVCSATLGQSVPSGFNASQLATGLNPTAATIAPDGRLYIAEKNGDVLIYDGENLLPTPFISVNVDVTNERGLSGIAFHPDYEQTRWVYLYYTVPGENHNRLSRFTANGDVVLGGSEEILLELDPLSGTIHNGGAMEFGSDGKLYLAVGDGANPGSAQSQTSLLGKILRLNEDGSIPEDNPYFNTYSGNARAIYAAGLRNPFTMDITDDDRIFVNDVGQENYEEVNDIVARANYGWPLVEGPAGNQSVPQGYQDPFYYYSHDLGCAIVGAAFYDPVTLRYPEKYHGRFFFSDYCEGYIKVLDVNTGQVTETFGTGFNRPLAMEFREDGQLYFIERAGIGGGSPTDNQSSEDGALWLISFVDNGKPFIGKQPESQTLPIGETAVFSVNVSGDTPITYGWTKDGIPVGGNAPVLELADVQLSDDGAEIRCTAENAAGSALSEAAILNVTANQRPVPVINLPDPALPYGGGETIMFSGVASDPEDGELTADAFTWWVDFHHDAHTHPAMEEVTGIESGEFTIPAVGEISSNVWYRIYLKVTDAGGLSQTTYREIYPRTSQVTVFSEPENLMVQVDGTIAIAPYQFTGVEGVSRSISPVIAQTSGNKLYVFAGWQDGYQEKIRTYATPEEDSSIVIRYVEVPVGTGSGLKGEYFNQSRILSGPPDLERVDATVDFDWEGGSPDDVINNDNFTARWTGKIVPQFTERYQIYVTGDDGVRMYLNGKLVINGWVPQAPTQYSASMNLTAGVPYDIILEYFEDGGGALVKLEWESETLPRATIPKEQMYVSSVTGTEEEKEAGLTLFPNPATSFCTIMTDQTGILEIRNGRGQLVRRQPINRAVRIDMSQAAAGIYVVRVISANAIRSVKLIKE